MWWEIIPSFAIISAVGGNVNLFFSRRDHQIQCFGSGSRLDPDAGGILDPDPGA